MKDSKKKRILIIEDEEHIAEGLKLNLSFQGYEAETAQDGVAGLRKWKEWRPDLIVLDIMMPVLNGFSVLQNIRLEDERIPVLILSAKSATDDKVKGLSLGVDDYLSKPFNLEEFLLRVERLLTRTSWYQKRGESSAAGSNLCSTSSEHDEKNFSFGNNRIDFETAIAYCKCGKIQLTEQEIRLLKLFIVNQGIPLSRSQILEIGWGYTGSTTTRTIDNFIVRFRKYFEDDPRNPVYFKSIRSIGYIFDKTSVKM